MSATPNSSSRSAGPDSASPTWAMSFLLKKIPRPTVTSKPFSRWPHSPDQITSPPLVMKTGNTILGDSDWISRRAPIRRMSSLPIPVMVESGKSSPVWMNFFGLPTSALPWTIASP